ncbi:hypothetical protein KAI54_03490, partial [Candidatus Gracilibacteria bacterium]|nr:hypothetical protein [Candidatus Gracilibacteria bacterium]
LDLVEKDSTNWSIVGDAGGTLQYDEYFMFDGQGLVAGEEYLLLSYKEDWPGCGSIKLGTGTADSNGDVRIVGEMDYVINDYPYGFGGDYEGVSGAKIWLVPTADKTGDCFNAWNPTEYLFENNLINQ